MSKAANLFSSAPLKIKPLENKIEEEKESRPFVKPEMSVAEVQEREERTIFVGNVGLSTNKKTLLKLFKPYGKIEKLWMRSLPLDLKSKVDVKGKAILQKYSDSCDSKNSYILFKTKEQAEKALEANGQSLKGFHLRVTLASKKVQDFKSTIFIGNLAFVCNDEELRTFFENFGKVDYVRIIRDPLTKSTKGFAYVKFVEKSTVDKLIKIEKASSVNETKALVKQLVNTYNEGIVNDRGEIMFKERNLRISKARKNMVKSRKDVVKERIARTTKKGAEKRLSLKERREIQEDVKAISKGVRMGTGGYDLAMMQNVVRNVPVAPQSQVSKRIKKIQRKTNLNSEQKAKQIIDLKQKQSDKLKTEVIETEGLLKKRREVKKMKKRMNIRATKLAQK